MVEYKYHARKIILFSINLHKWISMILIEYILPSYSKANYI